MIVIVTGLPGSGKSYFAKKLAERLGGLHINSDHVRKEMGASGQYSLEEKLTVYKRMVKIVRELLSTRKTVIVDATFYMQKMRDLFLMLARQRSHSICFIHVTASESVIKERLTRPRQDSEADFRVYEAIRDEFEELKIPHLMLVSTNDNVTPMVNKAIEYIEAVREG